MLQKNQHVVPTENGGGVRGEGNSRLTKETYSKVEAFKVGREIAKNQGQRAVHPQEG